MCAGHGYPHRRRRSDTDLSRPTRRRRLGRRLELQLHRRFRGDFGTRCLAGTRPACTLRADPTAAAQVRVATGSRPESGSGSEATGLQSIRVVNGDPAQFGSGQTRGINDVSQFVHPRAEAAHLVFEAQFAEDLQCAGREHMGGRWVDGARRRSTTRVSIPCSASSSAAVAPAGPAPTIRTREVLMSLPGCAEFGVHHATHQRLAESIVLAPSKPRPTRNCRSLYLKLNRPRFRAHFDVPWGCAHRAPPGDTTVGQRLIEPSEIATRIPYIQKGN